MSSVHQFNPQSFCEAAAPAVAVCRHRWRAQAGSLERSDGSLPVSGDQRDLGLGFEEHLQTYLREFEYRHNLAPVPPDLMFALLLQAFPKVRVE